MQIKFDYINGILRLYFDGELDEHYAKGVKEYIDNLCDSKRDLTTVVFNFSKLKFMDSTGIGILLGRYKRLKKLGIFCFIENPTISVEKVIELASIYDVIPKM